MSRGRSVPAFDRAISDDVRGALAFLETIENPRAPWGDVFDRWAQERGLGPDLAKATRVQVVRLRMFGSARPARRRR